MKKRILAAVLAMLLVFGFTTVSAWAAAAPVTDAAGLTAALANGGEIILNSDDLTFYVTSNLTITKDTTIDLNGKTIYFSYVGADHQLVINSGVKLTITDSSAAKEGDITGDGDNINGRVINNGTLILNAGSIFCGLTNNGTFDMNGGIVGNPGNSSFKVIVNNGTMYADGGKAPSYYGEDSDNYGTITVSTGCTAPTEFGCDVNNLTGGEISGGIYTGQVKQTGANTTISGGTFNGTVTGQAGTISGGTFNGHVQTNYENAGATVSGGIFYGTYNFNTSNVENSAYVDVAYDSKGGTVVYPEVIIRGQKATEPTAPKKAGFIFKGWYKDADLTEEYDFDSAVISGITLYAGWDICCHADNTNALSCTEDTICSVCSGTIKAAHSLVWKADATHYWQECYRSGCDYTTVNNKKEIPTIEIKGKDKVHTDQDYTFSFELPEDSTVVCVEYTIPLMGSFNLKVNAENGIYTGVMSKDNYAGYTGAENFRILVTVKTNDGYEFETTKDVKLTDEHEGGTATCNEKAICDVCREAYGEENPNNHANLKQFPQNAATAAEEGNKEYWYCDGCKKYFSDEDGINEIKLEDTIIAKLAPSIIKGDGQTITEGEKKALEFTSDAAFADFIRVEVDGKTIDESNYTVKSGSIVVTLNADYVATLSAGEHALGIVSQSGTATAKFTVNEKVAETTTPTTTDNTKSPQTGDNSHIFLWLALLFVSGGAVIATTIVGRKKRRAE